MPRLKQLELFDPRLARPGWGGWREGAGRKPSSKRPPVHHVKRGAVPGKSPCHVRLRVREGVPSLRNRSFMRQFQATLAQGCERGNFRVVHYSVQRNHVHMIVEAQGKEAMACGMKSVATRFAKAVQKVFELRGKVLFGRYWIRALKTPREVRHALAHVLLNSRRHAYQHRGVVPRVGVDTFSSGKWFNGWSQAVRQWPDLLNWMAAKGKRDVAHPHTWLLKEGWRRHRLISPEEVPGVRSCGRMR